MSLAKVEGFASLCKDTKTGAVINNDIQALREAQKRKKNVLKDKEKIITLEERITTLESLVEKLMLGLGEK